MTQPPQAELSDRVEAPVRHPEVLMKLQGEFPDAQSG